MTTPRSTIHAETRTARLIAACIIETLKSERGAHAETVIAAAARMGGTFLFRTFGLPTTGITPGSPVLSDSANERGPLLIDVMTAGLIGLGIEPNSQVLADVASDVSSNHAPHLTVIEMQQKLDTKLVAIASANGLIGEGAARACVLAAAILIQQTRAVLDPAIGFAIATYGVIEGTKTMPIPSSTTLATK